jgi:hypothetical protein
VKTLSTLIRSSTPFSRRLAHAVVLSTLVTPFAGAQTPAEEKTYQTSFEVAEALAAIDELWEEGNDMLELDRAQSSILEGACSSPWRDFVESDQEVEMLAVRMKAGESLTADERAWGQQQQERRKAADKDFDACFAREASRYEVLRRLGVGSNEALIEAYDRASAEYVDRLVGFDDAENPTLERVRAAYPLVLDGTTETVEIQRTIDGWAEEKAKLLAEHDKIIARFESVWDRVEIGRGGGWSRAATGQEIRLGDAIRTGPDGRARLRMLDHDQSGHAGPTIVNVTNDTHVVMSDFAISITETHRRTGLVSLIKGLIRAATKNWSSGSSFSVRTGTSLCGIRGTEIDVAYDPDRREVHYKLYDGEVQIEPGAGSGFLLRAGNEVTVTDGVAGPIRPLAGGPPT